MLIAGPYSQNYYAGSSGWNVRICFSNGGVRVTLRNKGTHSQMLLRIIILNKGPK